LYDHGTPIAFFSHRRLREKPPWGGVSVLSESTPLDPILLTHARALLDAVTWHGIAMVEFKVADDGTPYLMEINTRFWGSLQLATDAGVDFPWLLYNLACGTPIAPVSGYKTGCRLRWILGDLDSLYLTLQDNRIPLQAKMVAVGRFLLPSPFRTRHETNRWADLGPFWWELRDYVHHLLGRG
jgi:predicted ATP-grasp superfamily ATP-dependent carboligase